MGLEELGCHRAGDGGAGSSASRCCLLARAKHSCPCHPLAGIYFIVCMALLVLSLTETILIVRLVHKQDLQPHVPDWVKWLVLDRATVLLCCRDRKQFSPMWAQSAESTRHLESNDSSSKSRSGGGPGALGKGDRDARSWVPSRLKGLLPEPARQQGAAQAPGSLPGRLD